MQSTPPSSQPKLWLMLLAGFAAAIMIGTAVEVTRTMAPWHERPESVDTIWRFVTFGCLVPLAITIAAPMVRQRVLGRIMLGTIGILAILVVIAMILVYPHTGLGVILSLPASIALILAALALALVFNDQVSRYSANTHNSIP